jgi:hypothetical protein
LNGDMFCLPDRTSIRFARLTERLDKTSFEGEVEYADVMHRRTISLDRHSACWRIEDCISRSGPLNAETIFHLSPDTTIHGTRIFEKDTGRPLASFEIKGGCAEVQTYDYSPQYGVRVEAPCICVRIPAAAHEAAVTTIFSAEVT